LMHLSLLSSSFDISHLKTFQDYTAKMFNADLQKAEWKIKQAIANIVLTVGGVIFGGFVRDTLLHDHFAKKYYELMKEDYSTNIQHACYTDETVHPETYDRCKIPNDIDCYIENVEMLARLESALSAHKFSFRRIFLRQNASEYIPRLDVPDNSLLHIRYVVCCLDYASKYALKSALLSALPMEFRTLCTEHIHQCLRQIHTTSHKVHHVTMDVLVKKNPDLVLEPPFGNIDFECNALILTKEGIRLSNQLKIEYGVVKASSQAFKLVEVIQDITKKRAVVAKNDHPMDHYRFQKMRLKGWEIITNLQVIQEVPPSSIVEEDVCTICLSSFKEKAYKLKCCSTKYHKNCLIDTIHTGTAAMALTMHCIVCKRKTPNIDVEGTLLTYMGM